MGTILTADVGEGIRGRGMMRVVRAIDGFIKESVFRSSFPIMEIDKASTERSSERRA